MELNVPIVQDIDRDKISMRTMPRQIGSVNTDNMINEIFG
jgi:hypothetical protein